MRNQPKTGIKARAIAAKKAARAAAKAASKGGITKQDSIQAYKDMTARVEANGGKVSNPTKVKKEQAVNDFEMKDGYKPPVIRNITKMESYESRMARKG